MPLVTNDAFDCEKDMCDACPTTGETVPKVCTGVIGAHAPNSDQVKNQPDNTYRYGHVQLVPKLNNMFVTDPKYQCTDNDGNMGFLSHVGKCVSPTSKYDKTQYTGTSSQPNNNDMKAAGKQLWVDFQDLPKHTNASSSDWSQFDLNVLHKVWGAGSNNVNFGVSAENVYILDDNETVIWKKWR